MQIMQTVHAHLRASSINSSTSCSADSLRGASPSWSASSGLSSANTRGASRDSVPGPAVSSSARSTRKLPDSADHLAGAVAVAVAVAAQV